MRELLQTIYSLVSNGTDYDTYRDLKDSCRECMKTDIPLAVEYLKKLSDRLEIVIPTIEDINKMRKMYSLHKTVLLTAAPHDFESYILYIEWNRDPKKKFYPPRRKALHHVVEALQELVNDKLDLLAVSLPPGCGKTTLAIFYLTYLAGRIPDKPMLTGSHSNSLRQLAVIRLLLNFRLSLTPILLQGNKPW